MHRGCPHKDSAGWVLKTPMPCAKLAVRGGRFFQGAEPPASQPGQGVVATRGKRISLPRQMLLS